jgi:hypothetical protein
MRVLRQGEEYPYEIIRHNFQLLEGSTTVDIVRGESAAELAVERFDRQLTDEERKAGWSHFSQRTTKQPWPKPKRPAYYKPGRSKR